MDHFAKTNGRPDDQLSRGLTGAHNGVVGLREKGHRQHRHCADELSPGHLDDELGGFGARHEDNGEDGGQRPCDTGEALHLVHGGEGADDIEHQFFEIIEFDLGWVFLRCWGARGGILGSGPLAPAHSLNLQLFSLLVAGVVGRASGGIFDRGEVLLVISRRRVDVQLLTADVAALLGRRDDGGALVAVPPSLYAVGLLVLENPGPDVGNLQLLELFVPLVGLGLLLELGDGAGQGL